MMILADFYEIWNDLHIKSVQNDPSTRNDVMADFCESQIILAKKAYYDTGNPIMEDMIYDKFEDYLKIIRPDSKVLEKVGTDLKSNFQVL